MDILSHPLTALALGAACGVAHTPGRRRALVIASLLPDADQLLHTLSGPVTYFLHHRCLSHSLTAAPVLVALAAFVAARLARGGRTRALLAPAAIGVLSHLALDMLTSYPTRALSPFSHTAVYGDLLYLFDVAWIAMMLLALVWSRFRGPHAARATMLLALAYLGHAAWNQSLARATLARAAPGATRAVVVPAPFSPFDWLGLTVDGETLTQWQIRTRPAGARALSRFPLPPPSPELERALTDPRVAFLISNSRFVALAPCPPDVLVIDVTFSNPLAYRALTGAARAIVPQSLSRDTRSIVLRVGADGALKVERIKLSGPCLGGLPDPMTGAPPAGGL